MYSLIVQHLYILQSDHHKSSYNPSAASFCLDGPSTYSITSWSNDSCSSSSHHVHIPSMQRSKMPSPRGLISQHTGSPHVPEVLYIQNVLTWPHLSPWEAEKYGLSTGHTAALREFRVGGMNKYWEVDRNLKVLARKEENWDKSSLPSVGS